MKIRNICIAPIAFLFLINSFSQESTVLKKKSWYVPDYAKVQFAGNIGLVSVGVGYRLFNKVLYSELLYGYVPESVSKSDKIQLITIKNTFPILTKEIGSNLTISPIAGFTASLDIRTNSFTKLPNKFLNKYYISNPVHFTLFTGASVHTDFINSKIFKGADFYFEVGTVETYLWYAIRSKEVSLNDVFSTAIGMNFCF